MIKKASEILLDAVTRASYDALIQARLLRKKRDMESAADIRAMKSTLQAREAEALLASMTKGDNLSRLRDETATYRAEKAERAAKKEELAKKNEALKATLPSTFHIVTVLIKWDSSTHRYTESDISSLARPFGSVEATLLTRSDSATIVLSSEPAALDLVKTFHPESSEGRKHGFIHVSLTQSTAKSSSPAPAFRASAAPSSPAPSSTTPSTSSPANDLDDDDYEAMVFARMKGASKRSKTT